MGTRPSLACHRAHIRTNAPREATPPLGGRASPILREKGQGSLRAVTTRNTAVCSFETDRFRLEPGTHRETEQYRVTIKCTVIDDLNGKGCAICTCSAKRHDGIHQQDQCFGKLPFGHRSRQSFQSPL